MQVTCSTNAHTVGGTISGLSGAVTLQNNGTDNLSLNSNGEFTFSTPVAQGAAYNVTVLTQPITQTCTVTNDSGIVGVLNVTNVSVNCITNTTTLSTSISDLALSVTGLAEYGVGGGQPYPSGSHRRITITNTGSNTAFNLLVTPPTWPTDTTSSTTCGSTLAPSGSCTFTILPGSTATSDGTNPCSTLGTAPIPGVVQITADNATTVSTNVVVLSYGCIYQGGYVYAFDDTTPTTGSVGGKVATTSNQAPSGVRWSSEPTGNVAYNSIYGISETSTTSSPDPSSGQVAEQMACNGDLDGACDTNNIYVYYQNNATGAPINLSLYATGLCKQTIDGFSDWYLPAICEMGYEGLSLVSSCGTMTTPRLQNVQSSLIDFSSLLLQGNYWSSTEVAGSPFFDAWIQIIDALNPGQSATDKGVSVGVLCSRAFKQLSSLLS